MAAEFPPKFWSMTTGVWNTDAQAEFVIHTAGDASLKFNSTAVGTEMRSGVFTVEAAGQKRTRVTIQARQSDITAGNNIFLTALILAQDRKTVISVRTLFGGVLPAVDTFFRVGGLLDTSGADRYFKIGLRKSTPAFEVYWDALEVKAVAPGTKRVLTVPTSVVGLKDISVPGPTSVIWSDVFRTTGSHIRLCNDDQVRVVGQVLVEDVAVNRFIQAGIKVTTGFVTTSHLGPKNFAHMSSQDIVAQVHYDGQIDANTDIILQAFSSDPVARNASFASDETAETWIAAQTIG